MAVAVESLRRPVKGRTVERRIQAVLEDAGGEPADRGFWCGRGVPVVGGLSDEPLQEFGGGGDVIPGIRVLLSVPFHGFSG